MRSLRGRLGTSISRDCFRVKAAIAIHLYCIQFVASSSHIALSESFFSILCPTFWSGFDCSFKGKLFSIFKLLNRALLLEINCTVLEKILRDASSILCYLIQVLLSTFSQLFIFFITIIVNYTIYKNTQYTTYIT